MTHFTIITVCFNEAAGIRRTCESILGQTHQDFEWIVIDGGSMDGTLAVLHDFRGRITHLVSEADEGIYDAMNKGLALTSGQYLLFMNGGDAFAADDILEQVAAAPATDLIFGDLYFNEVGGERQSFPDQIDAGYLLKGMIPHQACFYRRELFGRFGVFDTSYRIAGDYDLFVRLLEVGQVSYHHIPAPLAVFDRSGISSDRRYRALRKRENHRVRKTYFPRYRWSLKAWRQEWRNFFNR